MPTLILRFPGRRYHATPWGYHVNEGLIEWPPSPWRILRALLATGYTKLQWPADALPPTARSLLEKLAAVLPCYMLPEAVGTHSRHYMPLARLKKGREDTTLVFDTWAQVDDGELGIRWNVNLTSEENSLLENLVSELGYLGRSESWVEGELRDDDWQHEEFDVQPEESGGNPGLGWEQIPLLAAISAADYDAWRERAVTVARERTGIDLGKKKLSRAEQKKIAEVESSYPTDLISCLQVDTGWLQQLGWSQPPGSRKVFYWRRRDALDNSALHLKSGAVQVAPVEYMLLALATVSGNRHALPSVNRVLTQAELLHRAFYAHVSRSEGHSVVLSGCDADGKSLNCGHCHAHLLHLDLDGDDHIDHVLIWAPMGLDATAQTAIRAVRRTFTKGGTAPLRLAVAATGSVEDLSRLPAPYGYRLLGLLGYSTHWRSLTPFVPPRYMKKRGANSLEGQVAAELEARGLLAPDNVAILNPRYHEQARMARHVVRKRRYGPLPPIDCGYMLDLVFREPVAGPLALGYGSHFGLGLFEAKKISCEMSV